VLGNTSIGIFIFLVLIFGHLFVEQVLAQSADELDRAPKNITKRIEEKIHPLIIEWKTSPEPQAFASENDLQYSDGKIRVYLYLDDSESISKLPTDIDLVSSSGNIAVVYVDGRQVSQLSQLDFVQRIEPPVSGTFGPPQIADTGSIDEIFLYSITAIIILAVVLGIVFVSRRKIAKKF